MSNKIYISLPISGLPIDDVRENAKQAKELLESAGYEAITPFDIVEWDRIHPLMSDEQKYAHCMGKDIEALMMCDAIYVCNGWENSKGCTAEVLVAETYGKEIIYEGR